MFAIQTGQLDTAQFLVDAGAQICRRASCGISPFELALENYVAKHPRTFPVSGGKLWNPDYGWVTPEVTSETDEAMLNLLQDALKARNEQIPIYANEESDPISENSPPDTEQEPERRSWTTFWKLLRWLNNPTVIFDRELLDQLLLYSLLTLCLSFVTALGIRDRLRTLNLRACIAFISKPIVLIGIMGVVWAMK